MLWTQSSFPSAMKRFSAILKETWRLWLVFVVATLLASIFLTPIMLCILPMLLVVFFYFALVRYDEDGNFIGS
jgi:hypothetical protein